MAITVSVPGQPQVTVETGPSLKSLGEGTVQLTNAEQAICQQPGGTPSQINGYIDLSNLVAGDKVVITFYVKVKAAGEWRSCYTESYEGVQSPPVIHILKRPENHGLKITVVQSAGTNKKIDYEFFEES